MIKKYFAIFILLFPVGIFANSYFENYFASDNSNPILINNNFYIEPRFSYAELKQSSNIQDGFLWGAKGGYNLVVPGAFYFGLEGAYMTGELSGYFALSKVKSKYQDWWVEGRIGYPVLLPGFSFIPFIGIGYEDETNDYVSPTPDVPKNNIYYGYGSFGFLSKWFYVPCLSIGCNVKVKYPFAGNFKGQLEGEDEDSCPISHRLHYAVECPLSFYLTSNFEIALVPFYEYRHYCRNIASPTAIGKSRISQYGLGLRITSHF